jgi:hypothetical protein
MSLIQNKNGIDKINKKNIVYAGGAYAALDRDAEKQETK